MSPLARTKGARLPLAAALLALGACAPDASVVAPADAPADAPAPHVSRDSTSVTLTADTATSTTTTVVQPERPNLPRVYVNTAYPATTAMSGRVLGVAAGGDLQRAIDTAQLGDVIQLQAGATFTGNFVLRNKTAGSGWIVIRTSAPDGTLPAPGTRVSPGNASAMARVVTPNSGAAIRTEDYAHHYRLVGLEITVPADLTLNNGLVLLGDGSGGQATLAEVPHDVILDRVYIHGTALVDMKRCVGLNSGTAGIVDSYLTDCHHRGQDAQAIGGWNGPGPYRIFNNRLEGSGEVIMFGGADPAIPNLVPSDIEIGKNYVTRPMAWQDVYLVKNLFELKNAQRVRAEGNVFENNWADGQVGFALVWKSVNQGGACTWCVVRDVTFRYNKVRRTAGVLALSASAGDFPAQPASHFLLATNILEVDSTLSAGGTSAVLQFLGALSDVSFQHNTLVRTPSMLISFAGGSITRFGFSNNIAFTGVYGMKGSGASAGSASLAVYAPNAAIAANILVGADPKAYPAGSFFPANIADAGMLGWPNARYWLESTSPYKYRGTDGIDPGAQYTQVESASSNVAW